MTTLHLVAYACEPNKGSEPGAGWNILNEAVKHFPSVVVYTRENNAGAIKEAFEGARVDVRPVRLPGFLERLKRGQRGVRTYYLGWQLAAARQLRRELQGSPSSVVHHATFATVTIPPLSLWGARANDQVLLGPVGGLVRVPPALLRRHFPIGSELLREVVRDCAVWTVTRNPLLRSVLKRCDLVFVQSSVDRTRLSRLVACEPEVLTNSGVTEDSGLPRSDDEPEPGRLIFAGDLTYAKGVLLLPELVRSLPTPYHLVMYGEGPAKRDLQLEIARCGVQDRVHLAGRVTQTEIREALAQGECMVLPSFREGAPAIVSEALQAGCRVVALDVGGIGAIFSRIGSGVRLVPVASRDLTEELRIAVLAVSKSPLDVSVETWAQKGERLYASVPVGARS